MEAPLRLMAPLSMGFSRQEYWSGLSCPPPEYLPNPGTEPRSPTLQADSLLPEHQGSPRILEWVAYPFSRGTYCPRNPIGVFCIKVDSLPAELPGKFSSVQSLSYAWVFATPWTAARRDSLSITNSRSLLKFLSIESVMPSHPLSSPFPPAFNLSQYRSLFKFFLPEKELCR